MESSFIKVCARMQPMASQGKNKKTIKYLQLRGSNTLYTQSNQSW